MYMISNFAGWCIQPDGIKSSWHKQWHLGLSQWVAFLLFKLISFSKLHSLPLCTISPGAIGAGFSLKWFWIQTCKIIDTSGSCQCSKAYLLCLAILLFPRLSSISMSFSYKVIPPVRAATAACTCWWLRWVQTIQFKMKHKTSMLTVGPKGRVFNIKLTRAINNDVRITSQGTACPAFLLQTLLPKQQMNSWQP